MIYVVKVNSQLRLKIFIDLPRMIYAGDQNYLSGNDFQQEKISSERINFLYNDPTAELHIAYKYDKPVGRIALQLNNKYNEYYRSKTVFFGFFDTINDYDVAAALFNSAISWAKDEDINEIFGPVSYVNNEPFGTLVHGYDQPLIAGLAYNKEYYSQFITSYGFEKKTDYYTYKVNVNNLATELQSNFCSIQQKENQEPIILLKSDKRNLNSDMEGLKLVYKNILNDYPWLAPMSEKEIKRFTLTIKKGCGSDSLFIATQNNDIIGFSFSEPIYRKMTGIKLWNRMFYRLSRFKNKPVNVTITSLGALNGHHKFRIEYYLFANIILACNNNNIPFVEVSPVHENNAILIKAFRFINAVPTRTFRMYELTINKLKPKKDEKNN